MKQRLLVMNGQRIVQTEKNPGDWQMLKVDKALTLKAGIYNIYNATQPIENKSYQGVVVHTDKESVVQQIGKNFIKHDRINFDKVPVIGSDVTISYSPDSHKAVTGISEKIGRSQSR